MRILTVSHFFERHGGGIERVAGHLCRQFDRLGAESVWAASDCDTPPSDGLKALPLSCINPTERLTGLPMPIPRLRAGRRLAQEVRSSDAVVVHDALYVTSIFALLIAKALGKRVILVQHIAGIPFSSRILRSVMALANALITRPMLLIADERVFISETVRRELLGKDHRLACKLLFNGVDGTIFHPGRKRKPKALQGIGLGAAKRRLLFVGRYVEKKGLTVLRALARSHPDWMILLAGTGPIDPSEWGLSNVHDLGPQTPQAIADLYRWSDLLVLPSVGEGYPLVIQEAMACGLPVVCGTPTDEADPDAAKWLRGVPIDLSKPEASAQHCAAAIESFDLSAAERADMAHYALQRYDWRQMAEMILSLARRPTPKVSV